MVCTCAVDIGGIFFVLRILYGRAPVQGSVQQVEIVKAHGRGDRGEMTGHSAQGAKMGEKAGVGAVTRLGNRHTSLRTVAEYLRTFYIEWVEDVSSLLPVERLPACRGS